MMDIVNRFGPGVLLEVLKFAEDKSVVARELVQAVHRSNHGFTQWTGALVAIHDPRVIASFISERVEELELRNVALIDAQLKSIHICFDGRWSKAFFGCNMRHAQGLLAALLVAPSSRIGWDAFVATEVSVGKGTNVILPVSNNVLVTGSPSAKSWFGPDPRMPQPGETWVVGRDDPERLNIHRASDGQTQLVFPNMVFDETFFVQREIQ
jgi:hypothetical protein